MRTLPTSEQAKFKEPYKLKPTVFPSNFILVVDSREQKSLFATPPKGLIMVRDKLDFGDYSIRGLESLFCVERKGIGDLFPYCSTEREKTVAKMEQFRSMIKSGGWCGLVIEEKESDIYRHQTFTKIHPESVRGAIISFNVRYGVHTYFGNRENCTRWLLDRAVRFYNIIHEI
jgi:ERCC4-type nuclease